MHMTFCGGVRGVTGSCTLLEIGEQRLLIDCGMLQGKDFAHEHIEAFPFTPRDIDAVILTHAHYDHCGRLPILVRQGFSGKIFCTAPTKALMHIILEDAFHVMAHHAQESGIDPFFTLDHVKQVGELVHVMNYHTVFSPIKGVSAMLSDAGHILGSAFVSLHIAKEYIKEKEEKVVIFSGDVGNDHVPILSDTEDIEKADIIVTESTYGNREHTPVRQRMDQVSAIIGRVVKRGGTIIIPAFSIERTQELLYELDQLVDQELLPDIPVYLDSPLAIRATEIYHHFSSYLRFDRSILTSPDRNFFSFPNLHVTLTIDESKRINNDPRSKIIIAGSGMMTGGRVLHHLRQYIEDPKSCILIVGYQAEGTLGRQIAQKQSSVKIFDKEYELRAEVEVIDTFSSHGDRKKIGNWLSPKQGQAKEIYLVHGENDAKESFKHYLEEHLASTIHIPDFWQSYEY